MLLPAHHLVLPEGVVRTDPVTGWAALSAPSPTWHPRTPAVGHGRIGGELSTCCPECGWELHRLLDLGTFPGADDRELPGELVTCVAFNCTWDEQFFDHADGAARPIERPARPRADWQPRPEVLPVLPVSFHPAPARWQLQDWMWSNGTQNLNRLGGAGSWIQDAIYPSCPRCRRSMPVLAQVDGLTPFDDILGWESWTEGLMYAFWCRECRVSAVSTQQT
ncbi:hypothetical protein [Ornithinimicrobium kibberense]|uniref:hypothetical protein n=1 Tax=Ornithinimicrobium kibberense TaxID=282060 RepID=UPI00361AE309